MLEKKEAYSGRASNSPASRSPQKVALTARQPHSPEKHAPDFSHKKANNHVEESVQHQQYSSSEAISELAQHADSKENIADSARNPNQPGRYVDYDNRPIKPLDTNTLYQQLAEYKEVTPEEIEEMREK